ncbi:serine hydrolase [Aeoliella sp. ICT_H6.2]|uniref:beta-lactamase n=1 Tax=Aeoliella straminimaris TaxID=2954799 RepID=A0A9X2FAV9_9BACT|nr:serine hydrolase [Aeoliella straminimaris]MCO6044797.1 serine hydrolase [Aeoliella straminimaris]
MKSDPQRWILATGTVLLLALVGAMPASWAEESSSKESIPDVSKLEARLKPLIEGHRGEVGVMIRHLPSGQTFKHRETVAMPTASLIKFPLLMATAKALEEGDVSLDGRIKLTKEDQVPGSGILTEHFAPGLELTLHDAIHLMIAYSDNTATNLVIDQVGLNATNELMAELGCDATRLNSKVYRRDTTNNLERSKKYGLGSTSSEDMVRLLEMLDAGEFVDKERSDLVLKYMGDCLSTVGLPRYLPDGTKVAHKTGAVGDTRTEAGIIYSPAGPIAISVLTTANEDKTWDDDNEAKLLMAEIAKAAYSHFVGDTEAKTVQVARKLELGAAGPLVESLQRTLNARLKPSPGLSVDGDFGPNTERAVLAFQKQEGLETTGVVDRDFWAKLGPLATEDEPTPSQEAVARKNTKKQPRESLNGPPVVTCKAWCFVDGSTGELLAGDNENGTRDPASVTKIMTAHLVLKYAEEHPEALDETITFSKRADQTSGSTSAVREGEKLPVRELLYGLMLPSGNDASVAFAEHFGALIRPDEDGTSYDRFIAEMNAEAERLGMKNTGYKNPHGLTAKGHVTSAWDMTLLAREAMKHPLLREIVSTRQHVYTVSSVVGYEREVVWNNTNRLLGYEGYLGVKTGTTGAAGACLVACGERNGRETFGVVLGSSCSDARYSDMRNLFRYVWSMNPESTEAVQETAAAAQ